MKLSHYLLAITYVLINYVNLANSNNAYGGLELLQGLPAETVYRMTVGSGMLFPKNISSKCQKHLTAIFDSPFDKTKDKESAEYKAGALQMLDSMGKPPSSVLKGNIHWLGNFEQCLNAKLTVASKPKDEDIVGKYCYAIFTDKKQSLTKKSPQEEPRVIARAVDEMYDHKLFIIWGTCLPNICTQSDINATLNHFASLLGTELIFDEKYCQTAEGKKMTVVEAFIKYIFAAAAIIVLVATIGDCIRQMCSRMFEGAITSKEHNTDVRKDFFYIFSARTSIESLFATNDSNALKGIDGIRGVSIFLVIVTHIQLLDIFPLTIHRNYLDTLEVVKKPLMSQFSNVFANINVFFMMSGLCLSYVVFNGWNTLNSPSDIIKMLLKRYIRMTIPYFAMMAYIAGPYPYTFKSAVSNLAFEVQHKCQDNMFQNILYLPEADGRSSKNQCVGGEYFIKADLHAYLLLLPLVFLINIKPRLGIMTTVAVMMMSIAATFIAIAIKDVFPFITLSTTAASKIFDNDYQKYMQSHVIYRLANSCIGVLFGYIFVKHKNLAKRINNGYGGLMFFCTWFSIELLSHIYVDGKHMPKFLQLVYGIIINALWSGSAVWIISQCYHHPTGKWNSIFGNKWLCAFGKLSYSLYLCHGIVHQIHIFSGEPRPASYLNSWLDYAEITFKCIIAATMFYCIVESPFDRLYKELTEKHKTPTRNTV